MFCSLVTSLEGHAFCLALYEFYFTSRVLTPELGLERRKLQGSDVGFVSSRKPGVSATGQGMRSKMASAER
jgi:hypothetical protein